jgi:hypothetical protein
MDWRIDPADLRDLTPVLARLVEAELAAGNRVTQTWRGWPESWTLCVMLERPFQSATREAATAVGGVYYDAVNDPHHWGEELVHSASGHMLVTEFHPRPRVASLCRGSRA